MGFLSKITATGAAEWEELVEPASSPTGVFSRENRTITRVFRVAAADTPDMIAECFPTRNTAGAHPIFPYLFVNDVQFAPMPGYTASDDSGQTIADYYQITINYTPIVRDDENNPPPDESPQDWLVGNVSFTTETMTLPEYGGLKWQSTNAEVKEPGVEPFIIVPITQYTLQVPQVSRIPWAAMRASRGRVNADYFFDSPPETLMYNGMNVSYRFSNDGGRQFDIEHSFSERSILWQVSASQVDVYGWNHFYNERTKKFDRIINDNGGTLFPLTTSFSQLMFR